MVWASCFWGTLFACCFPGRCCRWFNWFVILRKVFLFKLKFILLFGRVKISRIPLFLSTHKSKPSCYVWTTLRTTLTAITYLPIQRHLTHLSLRTHTTQPLTQLLCVLLLNLTHTNLLVFPRPHRVPLWSAALCWLTNVMKWLLWSDWSLDLFRSLFGW